MTRRNMAWLGILLGLGTLVAVALPTPATVRLLVVLAFACVGPGCALVTHLALRDPVASVALAVVLSLSIFVVISAVLVWTRWWHPQTSVTILAAASTLSCVGAIVLRRRPRPGMVQQSGIA